MAAECLQRVREQAQRRSLLSDEHFTVDGTLIEAWPSVKIFRRKDEKDGDDGGGRTNFRGQRPQERDTMNPLPVLGRVGSGKDRAKKHGCSKWDMC